MPGIALLIILLGTHFLKISVQISSYVELFETILK